MRSLTRILPYLLLAPALIPLVIASGLLYPFLVVKTLGFYALMLVTLAIFALALFAGVELYTERLRLKVTWIPGALLVLAYVASYFGLDFYRSFWSTYERGDGLLMLTLSVASFYLIVLLADSHFKRQLLRVVASVGSAVALYGVIEWLITGGRIESTIGNAALLAGYLVLALSATLALAPLTQGGWRTALWWASGLEVLAIILTATRGTILALGVVFVIACIWAARKGEGKVRSWSLGALIVIVVLGLGGFFLRGELAKVPFAPLARVAQISASDSDVASRLFIWRNMVHEVAAHPWLGVGAEHIDYLFNQFYDPSQITEEWFDRSHNAFLDYAVQYGILGFLLYSALIASFITLAVRARNRSSAYLALGGVAYAIHAFFVFDSISSWWLLLALFAALAVDTRPTAPALARVPGRPLGYVVAAILVALIYPIAILPLIANHDLAQAYLYHVVDVAKTNKYLENGLALGTYGDLEYGYKAYDMYTGQQAQMLSGADRVAAYTEAITILEHNATRYRYDARTALYLAEAETLAPPGTAVDSTALAATAQHVIALSPKRSGAWYIMLNDILSAANTHPVGPARTAGYQQALATLLRYEALVPTLSEPHFVLAELYTALGDPKDAASEAELGTRYYKPDLATAKRAATYYENLSDWANALFFLKSIVELDPSDYATLYNEAKVEYLGGNPSGALLIVQELRAKDSQILATDPSFLAAITQYENSH